MAAAGYRGPEEEATSWPAPGPVTVQLRGRSKSGAVASTGPGPPRGLRRSKSVVERLDAHAAAAILFDRRPAPAGWCPQDDAILRRLAASKSRRTARLRRALRRAVEALRDPDFLVIVALSAGGGAATLGTVGATGGLVMGASVGAGIGVPLAPLTLGLSVPVGLAAGGVVGTSVCGCACSGVGLIGGGAAGVVAYAYESNDAIVDAIPPLEAACGEKAGRRGLGARALEDTVCAGRDRAVGALRGVVEAVATAARGCDGAKVAAVSAAGGGGCVVLGAGGGVAGLAAGSALGAAWGAVPAVFTFGLSVPVGATVGGATGLCAGTALGSLSGLLGGGVVGCAAYDRRGEIRSYISGHLGNLCRREHAPARVQAAEWTESPCSTCTGATGGTG